MGSATAFAQKDDGGRLMIGRTNKPLKMRVLMVDDDLGSPTSMRGRVLNELVDEFASRNAELIKATSYEDGLAAVMSDAALHCICVDLNRPGFPRHFPGSVNVASQTLPVTAGC
jgi:hypothetical protein